VFVNYLSGNGLAVKVQRVFFAPVFVDLGLNLLALFLAVEVNVDVYGGREAEKALFREAKVEEVKRRSGRC
jgi:hypothetical protein